MKRNRPLSRYSLVEVKKVLIEEEIVEEISKSTLSRWFKQDALRPWSYRNWLFPRDPQFTNKASRVLDLYHDKWEGWTLGPDEYVLCADEKSQLQVLQKKHPLQPSRPGQLTRVEFEYQRHGTLSYQAVMDVGTGEIVGSQFPESNCKVSFDRLVERVMNKEPYRSASQVFWVVDNGPAHHPATFPDRLEEIAPHTQVVHLPVHASWLNQIELYFSILTRKALMPMDFAAYQTMQTRIKKFEAYYNQTAEPFQWNFTKEDLKGRMNTIEEGVLNTCETFY